MHTRLYLNDPFLRLLGDAPAGESMNRVGEGNLLNSILEFTKSGNHLEKVDYNKLSFLRSYKNLFSYAVIKTAYQINCDNSTKAVSNNVDAFCFGTLDKFLPHVLRMLPGGTAALWNRISE